MTDTAVEVLQKTDRRRGIASDRRRGIASLTLAFATDPLVRWGWPDPYQYFTYFPKIVDAFGGGAFDHGTAYGLEGCLAVALWLPPGGEPEGETVMGLMRESMEDQTFEDFSGVFQQMDEHHPTTDHWYLPLTGVDPSAQGRRLGSNLLKHVLTICDEQGLPAYLEATAPRNRNLYAHHGFNDVAVIQAGSSPPMWAMLREPSR